MTKRSTSPWPARGRVTVSPFQGSTGAARRSPQVEWPAECASMRRRRPVLVRQQTLRTLGSILSADRSVRHLFHARNTTVPVRPELFEEPRYWPSETVDIAYVAHCVEANICRNSKTWPRQKLMVLIRRCRGICPVSCGSLRFLVRRIRHLKCLQL